MKYAELKIRGDDGALVVICNDNEKPGLHEHVSEYDRWKESCKEYHVVNGSYDKFMDLAYDIVNGQEKHTDGITRRDKALNDGILIDPSRVQIRRYKMLEGVTLDEPVYLAFLLPEQKFEVIGNNNLAKNIIDLRLRKKLTQEDVANKLGITRTRYAGWEESRNEPSIEMLVKMSEYFDISIDQLIK